MVFDAQANLASVLSNLRAGIPSDPDTVVAAQSAVERMIKEPNMRDVLTKAQAETIVRVALETARANNLLPIAVRVLNSTGRGLASEQEDKVGLLRDDIAFAKAYGALGMSLGSRQLAVRAAANPNFYNSLYVISKGRLAPTPGGVLIRDPIIRDIVGAVGVSGDVSNRDEECAIAGIEAAGLIPDPGAAT